jgi:hypothetical protein
MLNRRYDLAPGGRIGAELIRDHPLRWAAMPLQQTLQQAFGRLGVAPRLDDLIEHIAILINRPSQPVFLAKDRDHDFVEMPNIATVWSLAPEAVSIVWLKLQSPAADRLVGDENTALEQHLLDQLQAQRKPEVQPHSMGDDLGWKAVTFVADGLDHASPSTRLSLILRLM